MNATVKKMLLLAMAFALFNAAMYAQEEKSEKKKDREVFVLDPKNGDYKIEIALIPKDTLANDTSAKKEKKPALRDFWQGIDIGFNGYVNPALQTNMPTGFERFENNPGKSLYLGFNLLEKGIPIYRNNVAVVTGLGIDYNNYRFKQNVEVFGMADSMGNYQPKDYITNRLRAFYVTVPVLIGLDFGTRKSQSFHVAFGVVGGIRFASHLKEKYNEGGNVIKEKTKADFDLNPFKVSATARVGYGNFTLFANYSITPLFKNTVNSPEVYPFALGISFGG